MNTRNSNCHQPGTTVKVKLGISDPIGKQGHIGIIESIEPGNDPDGDDDILTVKFEDGKTGKYQNNTIAKFNLSGASQFKQNQH